MNREPTPPPIIPDYELLKPIGRGSYGEVWLARSVTGVFRVIKVVRRDSFDDERPFRRELEGISRFQSAVTGQPRQLALLHVGRNDEAGYFYYVMEPADDAEAGSAIDPERYVPLTLKELFRRRGRLPAAECVQVALELARGLAVLHGANLIHRDIKPSNIIFVQRVPKLADVGLVAASEAAMTCVGTPGYLPPEGAGSVAADIYSFGKVLYELATGLDRMEFPTLPREVVDGPDSALIQEINSIVVRACHPDPRERQPTALVLARELELVQAGKSVVFYESLRRRLRVGMAAAAIVVAVIGVIAVSVYWRAGILELANEQARRALYRSDLAVAQLAKASGDLGRARAALQRQVPKKDETDLRGIEWSILTREVRGEGRPLESITNGVSIRKIMTDATGRWAAASFMDDRVGVWDLETGRISRVLENAKVLGGFLADGRIVVDEPVRALRFEYPTNGPPTRVETGQRLQALLPDARTVVVSPSGDIVFSILDKSGAKTDSEFNVSKHWQGFTVSGSDISPDGRWLALGLVREEGARRERWISSVDLTSQREEWRRLVSGRIVWIRCSPDNLHFVVNLDGLTPQVLRFDDSDRRIRLNGHTARVQDGSFSSDGSKIATAGADQTVRIWNVLSGALLSTHRGLGRPATSVSWAPNGRFVVAGDDNGNVRQFPLPPEEVPVVLTGLYGDVHGDLVFDRTGNRFAVTATTNTIAIGNTADLKVGQRFSELFQPITFSENGESLIAFGNDWSIRRVSLSNGTVDDIGSFLPKGLSVHAWSVSPSSDRLAVTGGEGQIHLTDLGLEQHLTSTDPAKTTIWAVTFSPNSKEVWTGNVGGNIRRWRADTGGLIGDAASIDGDLQSLALSGDGRWLAAGLFNDASVRIWDRNRQRWADPLFAHRRFVLSLVFTSDSSRLLSAGADGRIVVWRVPEFEEIASFEVEAVSQPTGDEGISVLRLAPSEQALGALTEDGRVRIWRVR